MKTSNLCFVALGIFTVTAGVALLGCGVRRTFAQDRPRPGLLGRLRSDAEPQADAKGATGSIPTERLEIAG